MKVIKGKKGSLGFWFEQKVSSKILNPWMEAVTEQLISKSIQKFYT